MTAPPAIRLGGFRRPGLSPHGIAGESGWRTQRASNPLFAVPVPQVVDQPREVGGQGGLDVDVLAGQGVDEAERLGVQRLAREPGLGARLLAGAVDGVADDRMADLGQMNADLVGPAGLEPAGEQGGDRAEVFDDAIVGDRRSALRRGRGRRRGGGRRGRRPGPCRSSPRARATTPSTTARYWRSMSCALNRAWKARTAWASAPAPVRRRCPCRADGPRRQTAAGRRGGSTGSGRRGRPACRARGPGWARSRAPPACPRSGRGGPGAAPEAGWRPCAPWAGWGSIRLAPPGSTSRPGSSQRSPATSIRPLRTASWAALRDRPNRSATSLSRRVGIADQSGPRRGRLSSP